MKVNMTSVFLITYCLPKIISYSKSLFCANIKHFCCPLEFCCHLSSFSHVVGCLFMSNKTKMGTDMNSCSSSVLPPQDSGFSDVPQQLLVNMYLTG